MVTIIKGNLLDAREDILVHQVNCQGAMGSGVALAIKEKWPLVYKWYKKRCDTAKGMHLEDKLLGDTHWCQIDGKWIVNLFGQLYYGNDGKQYTDYDALRRGLTDIFKHAEMYHESVAMPHGIGCGAGGGDWYGVVLPMIVELSDEYGVEVKLYQL